MTVDCPLDCPYLIEGRDHEALVALGEYPHRTVEISDSFLERNQPLYIFVLGTLHQSAKNLPGVIDADMREALAALVEKYRAQESGLVYEPAIPNRLAASVVESFEKHMNEFRDKVVKETVSPENFIDPNMFKIMVFLDRFAQIKNNGRPKGRHFISLLRQMFPPMTVAAEPVAE